MDERRRRADRRAASGCTFSCRRRSRAARRSTPPAGSLGLAGRRPAPPRTLVIPAATVARAVETLAERGYVGRGYLGLALQPLRRGEGGLIAVEVAEDGPAAAAGLLVGDIVTTWEGEALGSMRGLSKQDDWYQ